MRNCRIYHPDPLPSQGIVQLTPDAANHVARVLRARVGEALTLFDGHGAEFSASISAIDKRSVDVIINTRVERSSESPLALHLGQGISRGEKMDLTLQKSVELGVTEITPLITERCGVKLDPKRWEKKWQHWHKVIISACEQCGRNIVPTLHPAIPLRDWLAQQDQCLRLTLHPHAQQSLSQLAPASKAFRLLIGPEGGFTEQEVQLTESTGFKSVRFGPRILRTETAALAVISSLQTLFGDLG